MLALNLKPSERLLIGDNITISFASVTSGRIRLLVDAPRDIPVVRGKVADRGSAPKAAVPAEADAATASLLVSPGPANRLK